MLGENDLKLLDKIQNRTVYEDKFFQKRSEVKWFYELKKRGYFKPNPNTAPQETEKGYFFIPQWNVLLYLEKVSQQVTTPGNEKYIDELLNIIRDVTKYHIQHDKILDNYRTWWYFVKILLNTPNEKIDNDILNLIPVWLESKFDNTLPASEIATKLLPKFMGSDKPEDLQKAEKIVDMVTQIKGIPKYSEQEKKEIREKYKHIFDKPEEERTDEEKLEIAIFRLDEEEPKTIIGTHYLLESFINQKNATKVGEKCSENVIFNLAEKLKSIFEKEQPSGEFILYLVSFFVCYSSYI